MDGTIPDDIVEQGRLASQNLEAQRRISPQVGTIAPLGCRKNT
jgi:hypothetical protein